MGNTISGVFCRRAGSFAKNMVARFIKDERGETNLIAILLIIVVTVALVAIFKDNISALIESIFDKIGSEVDKL